MSFRLRRKDARGERSQLIRASLIGVAVLATMNPFVRKVTATAEFPWLANLRNPFFSQDYASSPMPWNPHHCNTIYYIYQYSLFTLQPLSTYTQRSLHYTHILYSRCTKFLQLTYTVTISVLLVLSGCICTINPGSNICNLVKLLLNSWRKSTRNNKKFKIITQVYL